MTRKKLRLFNFLLDTTIYILLLILYIQVFKNKTSIESTKWISGVFYFLYYFIFEYFKGQTIGKMITKSKLVVLTDNNKYFFILIFIRTLTRLIPFDIISYLFTSRGLHDLFSKTTVVNITSKTESKFNF